MTRDEIYDHLAQVYLGKKHNMEQPSGVRFNAWLVINIVITVIIFATAFYGLSAFLTRRGDALHNKVIFSLNSGPIRIKYNLDHPYPPVKTFSIAVPEVNVSRYENLHFTARVEEGQPWMFRVEVKNRKNETDSAFVKGVGPEWTSYHIPFDQFKKITDWSNVSEISFILESWNTKKKKGILLIDEVCFSS